MAFLANNSFLSQLRSHRPRVEGSFVPHRGYHIELGEREKALLAKDPALKRFKSHKSGVRTIKRIGDVLTIVVVARYWYSFVKLVVAHGAMVMGQSCCYEIYVRTMIRKEAQDANTSGKTA